MAKTELHNRTTQEKLNSMDVDLIDVTVSLDVDNAGNNSEGDLIFKTAEIPYAVAVNGGTAILQSCCLIIRGGDDDGNDYDAIDIVITQENTTLIKAGPADADSGDPMSGMINTITDMQKTCGFFTVTNGFNAGVVALANANNIGMICKAAEGTRSLFMYGIVQNTADYNQGSMVVRLGFIKD